MNVEIITTKMQQICEAKGLPKTHKSDLNIDRSILKKWCNSSTQFIWILRRSGTILVPLYKGVDPVYVSHWADENEQCFHVVDDKVNPIPKDIAKQFAAMPPFDVSNIHYVDHLIMEMDKVLQNDHVASSGFICVELTTNRSSWSQWKNWFDETGNQMMSEFMEAAMARYKSLMDCKINHLVA